MRSYKITAKTSNKNWINKMNKLTTYKAITYLELTNRVSVIVELEENDIKELRTPSNLKEFKTFINKHLKAQDNYLGQQIISYKDIKVERYYKERETK